MFVYATDVPKVLDQIHCTVEHYFLSGLSVEPVRFFMLLVVYS
jgi:hypothetical protein